MNETTRQAVTAARIWLDGHGGSSDEQITMRIMKLMEETGEAAAAWIGVRGQNPRKGVTHERADVAAELADVVFTALVAIESLGFDAEETLTACAAKVSARLS